MVIDAQCGGGFSEIQPRNGGGFLARICADGFKHVGATLVVVEQIAVAAIDRGRFDKFGVETHEFAQRIGDTEHCHQSLERRIIGHTVAKRITAADNRIGDIGQIGKRLVRVARPRQCGEHQGKLFVGHTILGQAGETFARQVEILQSGANQIHGGWLELVCTHVVQSTPLSFGSISRTISRQWNSPSTLRQMRRVTAG